MRHVEITPGRSGQSANGRRFPLRLLLWSSLVLPPLLAVFLSWINYTRTLEAADAHAIQTAAVLREHAMRVLDAQNTALNWIGEHLEGKSWEEIAASKDIHDMLAQVKGQQSYVDGIWLIGPDGVSRNSADFFPMPPVSAAERDYFTALREKDALYVGPTFKGKLKGNLKFSVSRRRASPDGAFDGVIAITLSLDRFGTFWRGALGSDADVAGLLRDNGEFLVRSPPYGEPPLPRLNPGATILQQGPDEFAIYELSSTDGVDRIYAFAKLDNLPVYAAAGFSKAAVMAGWRRETAALALGAALAMLLLGTASQAAISRDRKLAREIRKRARAEKSLIAKEEHLAAIERAERATKRAQEAQRLLVAEVDHRAKNALAVVQAAVRLTPPDEPARFVATVEGRISALARAHSLLAASRWEGASLEALVTEELNAYGAGSAEVDVKGPPLSVSPASVQALGMAIHELASNAAKYGALSVPGGRLAVRWAMQKDGRLEIRWEEHTPFEVKKPEKMSFGTTLIRSSLESQLGGSITKDWQADGMKALIVLPPGTLSGKNATSMAACLQDGAEAQRDLTGLRVLYAEDNAIISLQVMQDLQDAGCRVTGPATSISRIRSLAAAGEYDAALLDVDLNGEHVFSAAAELRAKGVPVVFCTGFGDVDGLDGGWKQAPVLRKPFTRAELMAALGSLSG